MKTKLTICCSLLALAAALPVSAADDAAVKALQAQVAELQAKQDIRELFTAYGRTLDSRDFKGFAALYARDAEYVGGGSLGAVKGPDAIAAMLEKQITSNSTGANLHIYSNEKITVHGNTATAQSRGAFFVATAAGAPQPLIFATYNDELVKEDGRWKFKRREVLGDIPGPNNEDRNNIKVADISGKWVIHSSVGGKTPITVRCELKQTKSKLAGSCTPEMANPQPSELNGNVTTSTARWGYDVVFNGKPGRVDFTATTLTPTLAGNLSLSGMMAPFTADRE
ncbi:MAG TPA: nuclear transport factor 2 family protein [Candidatus Acidoferrum sp.]|nr:nuclear transport factor 2 family protein [Candidatus Acidoferrum sp.]